MAQLTIVEGVESIVATLRAFDDTFAKEFAMGLKLAGLRLQRESQKVVPVDTATLKNSAFTRHFFEGFSTEVIVGYTASYAVYVHENLEAAHKPGKQAKFLEGPLREHRQTLLDIIYRRAVAGLKDTVKDSGGPRRRAAKGGEMVDGKFFKGGQFIT